MADDLTLDPQRQSALADILSKQNDAGVDPEDLKAIATAYKQKWGRPANPKLTPPAALPWDKQVNQMAPTDLTGEMPQNLRPLPSNATMGDKIGQAYQNIGASTADDAAGGRMALPFMLGGAEAPAIEAILAKTGAKAAGSAALRALLWGGAGAGVDAALGGDHPVRTGLETAGASLVPEIPGANKLLRLMLPPKFRAIFDMLPNSEKEKLAADTWRASGKAKVTKFGGPADPGYSPPSGPANVKIDPEVQLPWEPKKINYGRASGTDQPTGPSYGRANVSIKPDVVDDTWRAAGKAKTTSFGGSIQENSSSPSVTKARSVLNKTMGLPPNTPVETQLNSPEFIQALKTKPAAAKAAQDLLDALGMPTTSSMKLNIRRR